MFHRAETDAGRAALEYYESSLAAWRRQMRAPFILSLLLSAAIGVPMWLYVPHGSLFAAFTVGASWVM